MAVTSTNETKMPVTDVELAFRAKRYPDIKDVQKKEIACATCNTDLNAALQKSQNIFVHPILETLQCKKCSTYYGDGEFSLDEDGTDKYCRFCGNGGNLYICGNSECPYGFCKNCATKKVGQPLNKLEADDWQCLCCDPKPLWKLRAICASVITHYSKNQRKHGKNRSSGNVKVQLAEDDNPVESSDNDFERSESIRNFRTKLDRKLKKKKLHEKFEKLKKISALCDDERKSPSPEIVKPFYDEKSSTSADEAPQLKIKPKTRAQKSDDKQQKDDRTTRDKHKTNSDSKNNKQNVSAKGSKAKNRKMSPVQDLQSDEQPTVKSSSKNEKTITGIKAKSSCDASSKSHSDTDSSVSARPRKKASKTDPNKTTLTKTKKSLRNSNCSSNSNSEDESDSMEKARQKNVPKRKRKRTNVEIESKCSSKKLDKSRDSDSDEESDSKKCKVSKKDNDNKTKTVSIVSETVVDKEHRFSLSTIKPPLTKSRRLFSLDNDPRRLEEKQSDSSKITDSKLSKSKEYVTKQQAKVIRKHVLQVVNQMKTLGSALSFSADKLNEKYLRNNMSRIDVATKAIHKSRLLMNRSMKKIRQVDQEFTSSCKFWGTDSKVPSIAAVLEPFECDSDEIAELDISMPITTDKDDKMTGDTHTPEPPSSPSLENPPSPSIPAETSSLSKNPTSTKSSSEKSNDEEDDPALKNSDEEMEVSPTDAQTKTVSDDTEQSDAGSGGLSSKKKRLSSEEMNNNSDSESETLHDSKNALDSTYPANDEKDSGSESSSKNVTTDQSIVKATDSHDDVVSENNDVAATNGTMSEPVEKPIVSTDKENSDKESAEKLRPRRKASSDHDAAETQESTDSFDLVDRSPIDSVGEPLANNKKETEISKSAKNQHTKPKQPDDTDTASNNNEINGLDGSEELERSDCENHESPPPGDEHSNDERTTRHSIESTDSNNSARRNSKTKRSRSSKDVSPAPSSKDVVSNVASDEEPPAENDTCQSSDRELFENSKEMEDECIENSQVDSISPNKKSSTQGNDEITASDLEMMLDPEKGEKSISEENEKTEEKDSSGQDLMDRERDDVENVIMSSSNSEADNLEKRDVQWKDSETDSDEKLLRDIRSDIESANARHLEAADDEAMKDTNITADSLDSEEDLKRKMLENGSDLSDISEGCAAPNEAEPDNSEDERKKKMLASDTELSDIIDAASPPASPNNSDTKIQSDCEVASSNNSLSKSQNLEEELKRKILESDSDETENNESKSESPNDATLKTSGKILESDADTSDIVASSQKSNSSHKKDDESTSISKSPDENAAVLKAGKKANRRSSVSSKSTDPEDTELNAIAKKQLLSSSDDSDISDLGTPRIKVCSFANEFGNNGLDGTETVKSGNSETSKSKRKKFNIKKNSHYANDKKLQMICQVVVRRLNKTVLDQFANVLDKSKQRQAHKSFQSLVDLKSLKTRKKKDASSATSDSDNSSSKRCSAKTPKRKKTNVEEEKEDTLMDHLEKVQNGENTENSTDDQLDEDTNKSKGATSAKSDDVFVKKANEVAKNLLMDSSDSEIDNQSVRNNEEEEDEESNKKSKDAKKKDENKKDSKKKKKKDDSTNVSSEEGKEGEEKSTNEKDSSDSEATRRRKKMMKKLDKRNWKISDSDTSDDERRLKKSQKKRKSSEQSDADAEMPLEVSRKKMTKGKRRVLNSDSDSPKLTDEEENEKETVKKKKKSDSENSDERLERLKKRKRKQKEKDSNDSDSSPDEKAKKTKRKRIKKIASDSDSENQDSSQELPGKGHRKNIRKVLKDKQVADQTKMAGKEEEERLKRIAERQKLYNEMYEMKLAGEEKVEKLVLDFDEETKKELITVHPELVKRLKPHQAQGIKFMWDACFESLEQIKKTKGSGCILAHCMGLGKTFQVVTLSHTLLTHSDTGVRTIMVVCPLSTVLNWVNEFKSWLRNVNDGDDVEIFEMTKLKKNFERKYALQSWQKAGGVMVIGYEMFRILSNSTGKKMRKNMQEAIAKCLVDPGPDLIICDEGHLLKNEDTALSKAMKRVKTLRRVVLTGTPLQNNLTEYHCMVQFVKPNLLGTKKEFLNRFVNPITNGQFDDSTEYDVKLMKKRAHVLHKMLEGSVQRFDYSVLTPFLPPKQEYVISVGLSEIQIELYQYYIDNLSRHKVGVGGSLFADFQALQRIWTHPCVLRMNAEKTEKKKRIEDSDSEGSLKDFLDDGSTDSSSSEPDSDVQSVHDSNEEPASKSQRRTRGNPIDHEEEEPVKQETETGSTEWWTAFVKPEHFEDMRISSKLVLLFAILKESEQLGDKVLVFSQSLYALTLIEDFLEKIDESTQNGGENELLENHTGSWYLGLDYFRLDGQTAPENRNQYCKIFNNPKNTRARLFLISTRAGGLGINLTAANRVIIFDASWNPSHDVQSIFRIYRFGQKKPCYVYRFLSHGTMEEKIYNRQVTKLSLSCRVVDEQQIERHYSNHDLAELYQFEPNTSKEKPTLALPKDRLLAEIFLKYKDYIETYHEHDSLLENKAEEELDEEERKEAWKEYEEERKGLRMNMNYMPNQNMLLQQYAMANPNFAHNQADIVNRAALSGFNFDTLQALIQKDYPNATPEQQKMMTTRAVLDMYNYMENQVVRQHQPMMPTPANNFNYPTVNNINPASFTDNNAALQYTIQQQQRQALVQMQRQQQMNYAQRFGNTANTILTPIQEIQIDDHDVIEMESEPRLATPSAGAATPSSTTTVPAVVPVLSSKRQEE